MLARPRLDLHTLAVDSCLLVEDDLARGASPRDAALRQRSRAIRASLARMCRTDDQDEWVVLHERTRDCCARAAADVDELHRAGRVTARARDLATAMLRRIMDKLLGLTLSRGEAGRR